MTEREALKLALEALKHMCHYTSAQTGYKGQIVADALSAIDKALMSVPDGAQPEQEYHAVNAVHKGQQCYVKAKPAVTESHKQEPVQAAMKTVIEAMQQDPDYAWGWHCNIAMSFVDAGGDHYTGNQGAARFMRTLANVEPAHELPSTPPTQCKHCLQRNKDEL